MEFFQINNQQMSESLLMGAILSLSGGFMDAYTYLSRGQVFANAQTGNILLLGIHLAEGQWFTALRYFFPILAFALGIATSDIVRYHHKKSSQIIHWRQITILAETVVLIFVGFIPLSLNLLANILVSFVCGIQVESFRKIHGVNIATTMCIGNLRAATEFFINYFYSGNTESRKTGFIFLGTIIVFVFGAILGNFCVSLWKERAILVSGLLTLFGFLLMFIQKKKRAVFSYEMTD